MTRASMKYAFFLAIFLLFLIGLSGCILNPAPDKEPPPKPKFVYLDLTHKEDPIKNLVTAYQEHNITQYSKLLLLVPEYFWRNQDADINNHQLPEFVDRATDITMTGNMFLAADKRHPDPTKYIDNLQLYIQDGSWDPVTMFQGNPCEDCWETTRDYTITVVMDGGNTTLYGNDLVIFTIVPEMEGDKKLYKIGRMDDRLKTPGL